MLSESLKQALTEAWEQAENPQAYVEELRSWISKTLSLNPQQPVDRVRWVPIEQVCPNDYNPNAVAVIEMKLLHTSIKADGYTQPVVTIWNPERQLYEIVDGFHRYTTMKRNKDIREACHGLLPIVVIEKPINDRMASTVRHNRARGKHSIAGMSSMVFEMLHQGWTEAMIATELGMEAEEIVRLKHLTGFSKLFGEVEYRKAWEAKSQIQARIAAERKGIRTVKTNY